MPVVTGFFLFEVGLLQTFTAFPVVFESAPTVLTPAFFQKTALLSSLESNSLVSYFSSIIYGLGDFVLCIILPLVALMLCIGIITISNPIHSLLCLIGVFFHVIFVLLRVKAEFLALVFLIIYVGAIAVLFLFVIMLFNLKELSRATPRLTTIQYFLLGSGILPAFKLYFFLTLSLKNC